MYSAKICTFNLDEKVLSEIKKEASIVYNGAIGKRIKIPNNSRDDAHYCLLNLDFPENFQEHQIFIIDLTKKNPIEYNHEEHQRKYTIGSSTMVLQSAYPENLFDPKPLGLHLLRNEIDSLKKKSLFIVFAESSYKIEYQPVIISDSYPKEGQKESYSLYNFFNFPIPNNSKRGKETKVNESVTEELKKILLKHNDDTRFHQTFYHPDIWDRNKQESIDDPSFFPLMYNSQDEIISYAHFYEDLTLFVFPQIKEKGIFLKDFLFEFAPNIVPEYFPEIVKNKWTKEEEYLLPNHSNLLKEKEQEIQRHKKELKNIEERILTNNNKFSFLHEMLLATGDDLVKAVM